MGMASVAFMAASAMGVWSVRAALSIPLLGVGMLLLSLAGFALAVAIAAEGFRLRRMAEMERRWETEREIRPRL